MPSSCFIRVRELPVRLELRVVLVRDEEAADRAGAQLGLRVLEGLHLRGIGEVVSRRA